MSAAPDVRRPVVRVDDVADLITPMAVRVAATLRLAEHVADGVDTVADLAAKTDTHPPALDALVRHLVAAGVLAMTDGGALRLTTLGRQLRIAQDFLDTEHSVGRSELSVVQLLHSVRTGQAAYPVHFGRSFWEDLAADPAVKASFDDMTDRHLETELDPLTAAVDWAAAGHVNDLGAGNAALLVHLLSRYEGLTGAVLELPGTAAVAEQSFAEAGLSGRATVVRGSFFESLGHLPAGTFVLSSVLHDWNDEDTEAILRRVAEALRPGRRLLVIDSFTEDGHHDTTMDLRMLALFGGRQRTVADLTDIARRAGLRVEAARRLRVKWLIELAPTRPEVPDRHRTTSETHADRRGEQR